MNQGRPVVKRDNEGRRELTPKHDPIEAFRGIAQSAVTKARLLPFSHHERFGYEIDARLLVQQWDSLTERAERAEAETLELRATVAALTAAIGPGNTIR